MSGHSKWSTIKRKKALIDSKRSAVFTKLIKEVSVAAKAGGADPDGNSRLRLAIGNAKKANVPKDLIERAIKKASGSEATNYIETNYEGYGPGGVAVVVECATDNINRTVANVRSYFNKHGGSLGTSGSVSYLFEKKGEFTINEELIGDEDEFTLELIDAGADDVEVEDGLVSVTCAFEAFGNVNQKLEELNIEPEESSINQIPATYVKLDVESAKKVLKLIDTIEDDDDVQKVFHNLELTEELENSLE